MTFKSRFFSYHGRFSRRDYWLSILFLIIAVILWVGLLLALSLLQLSYWTMVALLVPPFLIILIAGIIVTIKRLHDRNKSGWFYVIYVTLPDGLSRMSDYVEQDGLLMWGLLFLALLIGIVGLVDIGFLRGTRGENRFGPDPVDH